jgi:MFS family permease
MSPCLTAISGFLSARRLQLSSLFFLSAIVTLMVVAKIDFTAHFELLLVMIVLNNIFCATQDVAIDSLAVHALKENERGRGHGFMFGGQYLGITLGGGAAIWVYGQYSFDVALAYISGPMALNLLFVVFFVRDPQANPAARKESDVLSKLVANMTSFVKITYASFWKSGRGPSSAWPLRCCLAARWRSPTPRLAPSRWTTG